MSSVKLTSKLKNEYIDLYNSAYILPDKEHLVINIVDKIMENKYRYSEIVEKTSIPWYFVAIIHSMETSLNFNKHLHNGDPLTARTKHVPAGRPKFKNPPFSFEESAKDALEYKNLDLITEWTLPVILYNLEKYNGFGYRLFHQKVLSPYLWSFTNYYTKGKYAFDGKFDDNLVSKQCGGVALLKELQNRNVVLYFEEDNFSEEDVFEIKYSVSKKIKNADKLQKFLNKKLNINLVVDGYPGPNTSSAVNALFGRYLDGDKRN